jgi:hypothetical protein
MTELHRIFTVEEFAIPINEGPNAFDALIDTIRTAQAQCYERGISIEDLRESHWEIRSWPAPSDPEHLVIQLIGEDRSLR